MNQKHVETGANTPDMLRTRNLKRKLKRKHNRKRNRERTRKRKRNHKRGNDRTSIPAQLVCRLNWLITSINLFLNHINRSIGSLLINWKYKKSIGQYRKV